MQHSCSDQRSLQLQLPSAHSKERTRVTQKSSRSHASRRVWHATTSKAAPDQVATICGRAQLVTRRDALLAVAGGSLSAGCVSSAAAVADARWQGSAVSAVSAPDSVTAEDHQLTGNAAVPDYTVDGPLAVLPFPELEHTCSRCFPACLGNRCMLRLEVVFPKNGKALGAQPGEKFGCQYLHSLCSVIPATFCSAQRRQPLTLTCT